MITIKKNSYKDHEIFALACVLDDAVKAFTKDYCKPNAKCQTCEYKTLCYDLVKARDYAYKIAGEVNVQCYSKN